jgi:hypothetical protein
VKREIGHFGFGFGFDCGPLLGRNSEIEAEDNVKDKDNNEANAIPYC